MKNLLNKTLSIVLVVALLVSVMVITNANVFGNTTYDKSGEKEITLSVGESYTFNFNEGEVIDAVANTTTSTDADGNKFNPFLSQNGNGTDTATQVDIDTNGDGTPDTSTLKLSLTGWQSLYVPTDKNGIPFAVEPNTTYKVTINAYVESKSAWGQFFAGGGYKSRHEHSPYKSGGMIYDQASVYYGGGISALRSSSSTFTTGDFRLECGKFTENGLEYNNYLYIYSGLNAEKFDGTNLTSSVVYIDSIEIKKIKSTTPVGETTVFDFDTVKSGTITDAEGNSFNNFLTQYPATSGATQANIDVNGDGTAETSTLKFSIMGWSNSIFVPTDKNGQPYVIEPNTTYTITVNAYIEAKSGWGQFFIGGGYHTDRSTVAYKTSGIFYDVPIVYDGGKLSALRTQTSTFTTGDYTLNGNKFAKDGKEFFNYLFIQPTFGQAAFDGTNQAPSVVYVDSIIVTKTSQTVTATFDANGGTFADSTTSLSATQNVGEKFTVEAPTSAAGAFAGWSYTADGMPTNKVTSAMNGATLYAIYKTPVNVTLDANGGKFADGSASMATTQFDGVYLYYDIPTKGSDKFIGWGITSTAAEKLTSYKVDSNMEGKTLYAIWEKSPHGSYNTFERVIDYSSYTVRAWGGGNSWYSEVGGNKYPNFTLISDNTADGGKYLRFQAPNENDSTNTTLSNWLGHYGITMTASGNYNSSGSGAENLYLPENTSYRVTLKLRTVELSNGQLELYVAYGDKHHTAYYQTQTLISNIGECNDWTEISAVFSTPAAYTNGNLCFIGLTIGGDAKFEYHLDSVKLERVTATNIYSVKNGAPTFEKTIYGVPGTALPKTVNTEIYSTKDNTGYTTSLDLSKPYTDNALTDKAIAKFADCDVDVYIDEFTVTGTENQYAYCGFDTYDNSIGTGFDITSAAITGKESYSGDKSLKIKENTNTAVEIKNVDSLQLLSGKTYKVSLWYKSESDVNLAVGTVNAENLTSNTLAASKVSSAGEWTKATYLITPDKAYNEGFVPVIYAETGNSPLYIDSVTVSSAAEFVGGYKTGNNDLRFVMGYYGNTADGNKITIEGTEYTVTERGVIVTGGNNTNAVLEADTTSKGVKVIRKTDLSDNFDFANGTTLYSVLLSGVNGADTYKFKARGYVKLDSGETYYSEVVKMSAADAKIDTPTAASSGEKLYNGIVLSENWPPVYTDVYSTDELPVPYLENKPDTITIDTGRQLFVDDFLIADTNLTRTWYQAKEYEGNPIFKAETEIELGLPYSDTYSYGASASPFNDGVWYDSDEGLYKMWYRAGAYYGTALATSKDGINWERGEYDIVPGTNLVLTPKETNFRDSTAIILNPFAKIGTEKYSMIQTQDPTQPNRLVGKIFTSADGVHWTYRASTAVMGDRSTMFYNPFRNKWVYSIRSYWHDRSRSYSESTSLLKGIGLENTVNWLRADNKDIKDPVIGDKPQLYNVDAVAYESIMLGAFQIYLGPHNNITDETGIPKVTNIHLAFSRDGFHFSRSEDRNAFLSCSQKAGTWNRGYLTTNAGICMVNDDELWFYYTGFEGDETIGNTGSCKSSGNYSNSSTGLAKLRRDGFASMGGTGTLTTEKVAFSGKYLYINANAAGGSVKAELLDENGNVINGYSVNDCVAVTEDTTKIKLGWGDGKDLSAFAGKNVRFRFYLEDAELYSFWVTNDGVNGASNGYLAAGSVGQNGLIDTEDSYIKKSK